MCNYIMKLLWVMFHAFATVNTALLFDKTLNYTLILIISVLHAINISITT